VSLRLGHRSVSAYRFLWALMATYAAGFAALSVLRHLAYNTGRFDLGNMTQTVWSTAHGDVLRLTDLHGRQISRLGAHFDPILAAFAPLWWIWPSPAMLLVAQAILVALGALPVFWLARKHLHSERAALGFALTYLLYPPTQWLTLNEFHPVALACPFLLFAFWYLDEDRLLPFAIFAVLAATTKEEIPLVIGAMGIWYAISRRKRLAGAAIAVGGFALGMFAISVVVPHFAPGGRSPFEGRYEAVGGSPAGILKTAFTDPWQLLSVAFDGRGVDYLIALLAPLMLLSLLAPVVALVAAPELAANLLSKTPTQTSIHFHYTAGEIAPLVVASVLGAAVVVRREPTLAAPLATAAAAVALLANVHLGALPFWREFPLGEKAESRGHLVTRHDRITGRVLKAIPGHAVVSASNSLGAHLSERKRILSFPRIGDATWIAVDETRPSYLDRNDQVAAVHALVRLRRNPDWQLVAERDGILVFRRRA
jgi:uncharacterized membrane protein